MRLRPAWILLVVGILAPLGCDQQVLAPHSPPTSVHAFPSPIDLFIENEGVSKPQPWHGFVSINDGEIMFFNLRYGDLHYDFAGNWYSLAHGVKYGSKVGWLFHEDAFHQAVALFDVSAGDTLLFSEATWNALQSDTLPYVDRWLFEAGFLPVLVRDPDTPESVLLNVLDKYLWSTIAWQMLQNPTAQRSRAILTLLVNTPESSDATWWAVQYRARELLAALS